MDFRAPCGELAAGNRSKSFRAAKGYYFKIQDINIASVIPDNNQMRDLRACILYLFWGGLRCQNGAEGRNRIERTFYCNVNHGECLVAIQRVVVAVPDFMVESRPSLF